MFKRYHLIVYLTLAFAVGVLLAFQTEGFTFFSLLVCLLALIIFVFKRSFLVITIFLLLGFFLGSLQSNLQANDPLKKYYGKQAVVEGLVTSDVIKKNRLYSFELSLNKLNESKVSSYVKVFGEKVRTGEYIRIKATIKEPIEKGQLPTLFSNSKPILTGSNNFWTAIGHTRQWVKGQILRSGTDAEAFTYAMLTGQISDLSPMAKSDLQASGLAHLWSVSGIHTAFLVFLIMFLLRLARLRAGWQFIVIITSLFLFSAFSGFQPPVIRASIMASWLSAAYLIGRKRNWLPALSASALISLAINPAALFNASFQLSYATVGSLLVFQKTISEHIDGVPHKTKGTLSGSIAAQILPIPLIAYYFGRIPIFSVLANMLVLPIAAGSFYLAIFGLPLSAVGLDLSIKAANLLSGYILNLGAFFNSMPISTIAITPLTLVMLALIPLIFIWKKPRKQPLKFATILIISLAIFAVEQWWPTANNVITGRRLVVEFLDVGQGDATLITGPHHEIVLIDSGPKAYLIQQHLLKRKIKKLDLVVATHADADHISGLPQVLKNFNVRAVADNGFPKNSFLYRDFLATIRRRKIRYILARKGQNISVGNLKLAILNPPKNFFRGTASDDNSNSIVIKLKYYETSFLFTADATFETEQRLTASGLQSTVLKVAHHGSASSTSNSFLQKAKPKVAIISAGRHNVYGHPKPVLIARLRRTDADIYRTDVSSDIKVVASRHGWHVYP